MKLLTKLFTLSLLVFSLTACSTLEQHSSGLVSKGDTAYLKQQSTAGLRIPPGLSSTNVGNQFSIPPVTGSGPVPASPIPPGGITVPAGYKAPVVSSSNNNFLKPVVKS